MDSGLTAALENALHDVGVWLRSEAYRFTTVTPETHRRVLLRRSGSGQSLQDAFGWSLPFETSLLPNNVLDALISARLVSQAGRLIRSSVRFSTLGEQLYGHSAYPTGSTDSVFFGPDTYRFCALIRREAGFLAGRQDVRILDMGCGGGAGGIHAAVTVPGFHGDLILSDINPRALAFARANALLAGVHAETVESDLFARLEGEFDLIVSNPPYLVDEGERQYRHGGGRFGEALSIRISVESIRRLRPGGKLVLYTGSTISDGRDMIRDALVALADEGVAVSYEELDPDVFGEELERPAYRDADRIAAVAFIATRRR